jgi:hypothetical protein
MNEHQQQFNQRLQDEAQARVQRVLRLRAAGETWRAIGDLLGITRQRAQQLAAREARRNEKSAA